MCCCRWLCAHLCAFFSASLILVFDFFDLAVAAVLVYESLAPAGDRAYVVHAPATTAVAGYGGGLALLALCSCLGVGARSRLCLVAASVLAAAGLAIELAVANLILFDGALPQRLGLVVPPKYALILAAAAARHGLRLAFVRALGSSRAVFRSVREERAEAEEDDRASQLSQRLLSRRSEREELRRHFDSKYFDGKNSAGEAPPPPRDGDRSTELPSFLLTKTRIGGDDEDAFSFQV